MTKLIITTAELAHFGVPAQFYGVVLDNIDLYQTYTGAEHEVEPFEQVREQCENNKLLSDEVNAAFSNMSDLADTMGIALAQDFQIATATNLLKGLSVYDAFTCAFAALIMVLRAKNADKLEQAA